MVTNNSAATSQQTASLADVRAGAAEVPALNPGSPIEVVSSGPPPTNDPPGTDNKPPGVGDDPDFSAYV